MILDLVVIVWVACAEGDKDYCAAETFASKEACEQMVAEAPYGDGGVCLPMTVADDEAAS